jgi:hypothetical protein
MDSYLIIYVNQRMSELGIKKFHHEPVLLLTDNNKIEYRIEAYNQFYYLVSKELANGTVIRSDTNIYDADQLYDKQNLHQIQEFTGLIIITIPPRTTQLLEFIRVTH